MEQRIRCILDKISDEQYLTISKLQRYFEIGYNKAVNFIKKMEKLKVVAPYEQGSGALILDKSEFITVGTQEIILNWDINNLFSFKEKQDNLSKTENCVSAAMIFLDSEMFTSKVDLVLGTNFSQISDLKERKEKFYDLVGGNYARSKLMNLVVSDYFTFIIRNNLDLYLDEYWKDRIKDYTSFLENKKN